MRLTQRHVAIAIQILGALVAMFLLVQEALEEGDADPIIVGAALAMLGIIPAVKADQILNRSDDRTNGRGQNGSSDGK